MSRSKQTEVRYLKKIEDVDTPEELFEFLKGNLKYGVVDRNGKKWTECSNEKMNEICNSDWRIRSVEQILSDGVGHCYDFVEVERFWFEKHDFEFKTFWICAYQKGIENSGFAHSFLAYKSGRNWFNFEISDASNQGIHKFNNLIKLKTAVKAHQIAYAESIVPPKTKYSTILTEFSAPPLGLNIFEYVDFVSK